MFYVYVLKSLKTNRYYIGQTEDLVIRLAKHNSGKVRSTKTGIPWQVVYQESVDSRQTAYFRELQIKSYKGGEAFKKLVS